MNMTLDQIKKLGYKTLAEKLGPVGMVRFLQQFEMGWGDYTKERGKWLGDLTVRDLIDEIKNRSEDRLFKMWFILEKLKENIQA